MELAHFWGNDLSVSSTGDLLLVDGTALGQQRVLRRLLTNPLDYIWQPDYGAGLPAYVGQPADPASIGGVIRQQIALEAAVATQPTPVVTVTGQPDGTLAADIQYVDADTGALQTLSFDVTG